MITIMFFITFWTVLFFCASFSAFCPTLNVLVRNKQLDVLTYNDTLCNTL